MRTLLIITLCLTVKLCFAQKLSFKVKSEEGRFSLSFPMEPKIQKKEAGGDTTVMYTGILGNSGYLFSYTAMPYLVPHDLGILKYSQEKFMESLSMEAINKRDLRKGKVNGLYCEGKSERGSVIYELYLHKNILYQIGIVSEKEVSAKAMSAFSKSLKIKK